MLHGLLARTGSWPLALVRSPIEYELDDPTAPHLRAGLYVGNFGHHFYGQFRYEVILVELRECSTLDEARALFRRPFEDGGGMPQEVEQVLSELPAGEKSTFIVGQKVTGDFHVPAGQASFIVLLGPRSARDRLDRARGEPPRVVSNRTTHEQERIRESWPGFGTLAMPGFGGPTWADGWLVRLEPRDGEPGGADRFGFMWDRNQDAVILEYLRAQTTSPFLSRKWLPEGLR